MKPGMAMTAKRFRILSLLSCIGMLLVLLAGVTVTNTGSGEGCGTDWPLCHGKFIPAYTLESMIEYSHRFVTGIEGLLVLATFVFAFMMRPRSREALWYSGGALAFTVVQAILGMMAVIWPTSDAVMAIHFGISMIAFSFTWLLYAWAKRYEKAQAEGEPNPAAVHLGTGAARVPAALYKWVLAVMAYCYVVVYIGAYVRHTSTAGGCIGWPLCNGEIVPELTGATIPAFIHRVAAVLLFFAIVAMFLYVRKASGSRELNGIAASALGLVVAQILSGWLLTVTLHNEDVYVFTALLHTIIICILFNALCLLAVRAYQLSRR